MSRPRDSFINFRPDPQSRLRIFCFPYAGGGAHIYRSWAGQLPQGVEVYAAQFPGRGARLLEEPYTTLGQFLDESSRALLPLCEKPFAFFGHSMGALVCFELARLLRREGRPLPLGLMVSGRSGPRRLRARARLSIMPERELIEELSRFEGTPPEVINNVELMQMTLPSIRADFSACEGYTFIEEPPLPCSISAYGGLDDPDASLEGLREWSSETTAAFACRMFPGGHFFLDTARPLLLRTIADDLASWWQCRDGASLIPPA
jgi:medium-chain acyl-[acyl-carrier-protein] hydrolase